MQNQPNGQPVAEIPRSTSAILSFEVALTESVTDGGAAYRAVTVVPAANGIPVVERGPMFDTLAVLARRDTACAFDLFTCGCGEAGCAGIFEDVVMAVAGTAVSWRFPEQFYRDRLSSVLFPADQPLALTFDRAQYLAALDTLEAQLNLLEVEGPLVLLPEVFPESPFEPLHQVIARGRNWFQARHQEELATQAAYGALYDATVQFAFADGLVFCATLAGLADSLVYLRYPDLDERKTHLEGVLLPAWQASEAEMVQALRDLGWDEVSTRVWQVGKTPVFNRDLAELKDAWPHVQITVCRVGSGSPMRIN